MGYFNDAAALLLPSRPKSTGLRRAQHGALQAIGAHFTTSTEPCLVTLPTGSGKTAVMTAIPFFVPDAELVRVLVLTPSTVVRSQVTREFQTFANLRATGVITETSAPKVLELTSKCQTADDWERLREYDVVISTQYPVSPKEGQVCPPPTDLFQLVLVDEAHHASADTWSTALAAFPSARQVLLTATPYRRDRRELKAHLIFAYSLRQAIQDGVYQPITFVPVQAESGTEDAELCRAARQQVLNDRDLQKEARIIVRTDRVEHAKYLVKLYADHGLKVEALYAGTGKKLPQILQALEAGELDGIVAVGMLGEGFDLPALKIAVVHTPHKSLASTLQFVGRIARSAPERYGQPRFLAVPRAVNDMTSKLYSEDPDWAELIPNLADAAVNEERQHRRFVQSFTRLDGSADVISLYGLHPYLSGTVYDLDRAIDLSAPLQLGRTQLLTRALLENGELAVFVTGQPDEPSWAGHGDLVFSNYSLTVYFYDCEAKLLVEHTTNDEIAKKIRRQLAGSICMPVSKGRLSGILAGNDVVYVQLGLGKTGALGGNVPDYSNYSSAVDLKQSIQASDARVSTPHHVFAKVDGLRHVGFSGSGKVYSNRRATLEGFLAWAKEVTAIVQNSDGVLRLPGLPEDFQTRPVDRIPAAPIAIEFDNEIYRRNATLHLPDGDIISLVDLTLDGQLIDEYTVQISLLNPAGQPLCRLRYDCRERQPFEVDGPGNSSVVVLENRSAAPERLDLNLFLQRYPLTLFLQDGATIYGNELKPLSAAYPDLPDECYVDHADDWRDCEVLKEFWTEADDRSNYQGQWSVQEAIVEHARKSFDQPWILIDHGTGEMADVIVIGRTGVRWSLQLYHCKAAKSPAKTPRYTRPQMGRRVEDLYEVTGQAMKGTRWVRHPLLMDEFKRRLGSRMHEMDGREAEFLTWLQSASIMTFDYEVMVVQPALRIFGRKEHDTDRCTRLLLAAYHWTHGQNIGFRVLGWNREDQLARWNSSIDD